METSDSPNSSKHFLGSIDQRGKAEPKMGEKSMAKSGRNSYGRKKRGRIFFRFLIGLVLFVGFGIIALVFFIFSLEVDLVRLEKSKCHHCF